MNREHEVDSWRNNPTVQLLTFPKETCLHLILLLMKSTTAVAPTMREINGFKVHYETFTKERKFKFS